MKLSSQSGCQGIQAAKAVNLSKQSNCQSSQAVKAVNRIYCTHLYLLTHWQIRLSKTYFRHFEPDFVLLGHYIFILIKTIKRSDNIASLLSPSCKYAFAGQESEIAEIDNDFGGESVNHSEGLQVESESEVASAAEVDLEAMKYLAGYMTFKVGIHDISSQYF